MEEETKNDNTTTYGETIVGKTFNPSGNVEVDKIKNLYAEIIDILVREFNGSDYPITAELKRTAISQALIAQMCAVKVITFKEAVDVEEPTETETASGVTQPATEGTEEETTEEKE